MVIWWWFSVAGWEAESKCFAVSWCNQWVIFPYIKIVPSFAALKTKIEKNDEFSVNKQATRSYWKAEEIAVSLSDIYWGEFSFPFRGTSHDIEVRPKIQCTSWGVYPMMMFTLCLKKFYIGMSLYLGPKCLEYPKFVN